MGNWWRVSPPPAAERLAAWIAGGPRVDVQVSRGPDRPGAWCTFHDHGRLHARFTDAVH